MMFEFLKNNLLIICPNSYKKAILNYLSNNKKLFVLKFMTKEEYLKKIKFDYDIKAIHYLVRKGMKVDNAITFLDNLLYIEDKEYHNEKLDYLVKLKKELDDHQLLIYDKLFSKTLKKYQIVIYGYGNLDKWELSLFNEPQIINYKKKNNKFTIYNLKNINDEVEMVFQQIIDLLNNGIDINKISLMNVDTEYYPLLKRYAIYYQIPLSLNISDNILGTTLGNKFYQMILEEKSMEEINSFLDNYQDNNLYGTLINLLNKYLDFEIKDIKELIKYDLLNTKVNSKNYDNTIKIKNVFDYVSDDEYIFLVGFNNPSIPRLMLDTEYITDNIKDLVGLPFVSDINKLSKENTLNYLSSINNLIISYKETSSFNSYYPSILLDDMDYELKEYQRSFNYSEMSNKNLYTTYLDDYVKFGIKNNNSK